MTIPRQPMPQLPVLTSHEREEAKRFLRPCFICELPGWCRHREPFVLSAEAEARRRRMRELEAEMRERRGRK